MEFAKKTCLHSKIIIIMVQKQFSFQCLRQKGSVYWMTNSLITKKLAFYLLCKGWF